MAFAESVSRGMLAKLPEVLDKGEKCENLLLTFDFYTKELDELFEVRFSKRIYVFINHYH